MTKTKRPPKRAVRKPAPKAKTKKRATRAKRKAPTKAVPRRSPKPARKPARKKSRTAATRRGGSAWVSFVAKHGVVLASARGAVPSVAEAVAGEPIIGSWWAHAKGKEIFEALSAIDDSPDIKCFKLVDGKVTFVHKKAWPALVRLGRDGVLAAEQLAAVQQEHTPTGDHRNVITPFPDWVDDETGAAADALSTDAARAQLAWAEG